jgi:hypothetical protein
MGSSKSHTVKKSLKDNALRLGLTMWYGSPGIPALMVQNDRVKAETILRIALVTRLYDGCSMPAWARAIIDLWEFQPDWMPEPQQGASDENFLREMARDLAGVPCGAVGFGEAEWASV